MRVLVIDQCSGSKNYPTGSVVYSAEDIDEHGRDILLGRDESAAIKARNLYAGRQQSYIDDAVDSLRGSEHEVDRYFISAGFGLVDEYELLPPYEVTFSGMSAREITDRSVNLGITDAVAEVIDQDSPHDVMFFALGSDYYQALDLRRLLDVAPTEAHVVLFNQEELADEFGNVVSVPARTAEAKEQGTIVVALKGVYFQHFAAHVTEGQMIDATSDLVDFCMTDMTTQTGIDQFS